MALGSGSKPVVTEWVLDNSGVLVNVKKQAKAIRLEKKAEKELALVTKHLAKAQKGAARGSKSMAATFHMATTAIAATMQIVGKLSSVMGGMIKVARDHEDWIGKNSQALRGMSKASAGIISDLDLVRSRMQLQNGQFRATEKQMNAVSVAAVKFARATGGDAAVAMEKLTKSITTGAPTTVFRKLGFNIQFSGTQAQRTARALKILEGNFGSVTVEAANTNERLAQVKNAYQNIVGSIGAAVLSSDFFVNALKRVASASRALMKGIEADSGHRGGVVESGKKIAEEEQRLRQIRTRLGRSRPGRAQRIGQLGEAHGRRLLRMVGVDTPRPVATERANLLKQEQDTKATIALLKRQQRERGKAMDDANRARKLADEQARKDAEKRRKKLQDQINRDKARAAAAKRRASASTTGALGYDVGAFGLTPGVGVGAASGVIAGATGTGPRPMPEYEGSGIKALADGLTQVNRENKAFIASTEKAAMSSKSFMTQLQEVGGAVLPQLGQSLAGIAGGMWSAADAAIQGGESIGAAMAKMLKSTLLSIASEATVKSLMNLAAAAAQWFNPVAVASHMTAAGLYAGAAVLAGGAGLAMSAATAPGGSSSAAAKSTTGTSPSYQSFGSRREEDKRPVIVNIDLKNFHGNKAAARLAAYELDATVKSAA